MNSFQARTLLEYRKTCEIQKIAFFLVLCISKCNSNIPNKYLPIFFFTDAKSNDNTFLKIRDVIKNAKRFQDSLRALSNKRNYDLKELAPVADDVERDTDAANYLPLGPPYNAFKRSYRPKELAPVADEDNKSADDVERDADAANYLPRGPPPNVADEDDIPADNVEGDAAAAKHPRMLPPSFKSYSY